jgi:hypothetical protein
MIYSIVVIKFLQMRGKSAKLQLNNKGKVGFGQPCFLLPKNFSTFFQKPLDKVATMWYYSGANRNTKGAKK